MANGDNLNAFGLATRGLPGLIADAVNGPISLDRRGAARVAGLGMPRHLMADESTYFNCHNITNDAATTLAGHAAPVLVDADVTMTKPLVVARMPTGASVRAYLDYVQIDVITAGSSGTAASWAAQVDTGADRYSSGTVETFVGFSGNMQSASLPVCIWKGGPFVCSAETANVRYLGFGAMRSAIEFTGDRYTFVFGGDPAVMGTDGLVAGAASHELICLPPVILGPLDQFLLALYSPSQSGAGIYKVRCGWREI